MLDLPPAGSFIVTGRRGGQKSDELSKPGVEPANENTSGLNGPRPWAAPAPTTRGHRHAVVDNTRAQSGEHWLIDRMVAGRPAKAGQHQEVGPACQFEQLC
jgi:hypothetical protein